MYNRGYVNITSFALLAVFAFQTLVYADSWALPEKRRYCSNNKKFCVDVVPKKLEGQFKYFEDKVDGVNNAGAQRGVKNNYCKGVFFARTVDGRYRKSKLFRLVNEVAPVSAIVSDEGKFFVTFDNWHAVGYGSDVVVIYRSDGSIVRQLALSDILTEGDIATLPRSVSSIWWGGEHYIDHENRLLVLKVVANGEAAFSEQAKFAELKINLITGEPSEPKRDLLPQDRFTVSAQAVGEEKVAAPTGQHSNPSVTYSIPSTSETKTWTGVARIASETLIERVTQKQLPEYPAVAAAVRAGGEVIIELVVSRGGEVLEAFAVKGHPLLRRASVEAIRKWKFAPDESAGAPDKVVSSIAFKYEHSVIQPSATKSSN